MHLLRAQYGRPATGSQAPAGDVGVALASGSTAGWAPARRATGASARPAATASTASLRVAAGISDSDDVDDIVRQVRRDVAAIQHAAPPASAARMQDSECGAEDAELAQAPAQSSTARGMSRSQSEATWDRLRARDGEAQEEGAGALPKATVRGRYVFSGSTDGQVLAGQAARLAASSSECSSMEFSSQFSPRPPVGRAGPLGRATGSEASASRGVPRASAMRGFAMHEVPEDAQYVEVG